MNEKMKALEDIAYAPYERIEKPTAEDWQKSYDALKELCELAPEEGIYPNTLGYLCYYGRHTGGERKYAEARAWFEQGAKLRNIESTYKLADMLIDGLGGPADPARARELYERMYWYCRDQFESGIKESSFADTALRIGRLYHEGKLPHRDDLEALGFLLEAKFALDYRKQFGQYGDNAVEKNIRRLISECKKPDEKLQKARFYGVGLGRVPYYLLFMKDYLMTMEIYVDDDGTVRLEFRRKRKDGGKPNRILWSVPPAMRCFMTDFVVLYGEQVRQIWNRNPGETVTCDRYEYDETSDTHLFYLKDEIQCRLQGGKYALSMDEFMLTELRNHPDAAAKRPQ